MTIKTIFFDLDDTLYPANSGLWAIIKDRICLYLVEKLGVPEQDALPQREYFFRTYGTTLRGLQTEYDVDVADYLAFVHDVPLRDYIQPDPHLHTALDALTARKLIFTNADVAHSRRVLDILGVAHHFEQIIDINAINPYCKPMPEAFEIALQLAGNPPPEECAIIDDMARTTRTARQLGMRSILFGVDGDAHPDADAALKDWRNVGKVLN